MSNAPISRVHWDATSTEFRFAPSDLISSYLFSFVAGEFETVSRDVGGRQIGQHGTHRFVAQLYGQGDGDGG